ncbi:hypothetical protein FHW37_1011091 [Neorhizobium alkalisoli]|jgi:hypothetical protein|uniref:Uncharacterized protein n=1 Tax=Neorhizobium alkalisoli TaxID=528178 RepID=A0A561R9I0_9HYPH|nr:hypothetical protein FHW37_1011091 [Neorhizobium alkalisoli]
MDFNPIATPLCLAIRENLVHAAFRYSLQSVLVHA